MPKLVALALILALACAGGSLVDASSHPFSETPQRANASVMASRLELPNCSTSSSTCSFLAPSSSSSDGNETASSWPELDASYAGTAWLAPPTSLPATFKASDSYYQIAKLPLSRFSCSPGSEVEVRLVLRFPEFNATKSKTQAMAEQRNTAGIMATSNPLAVNKDNGKTRRCVLAGVKEGASAAEAAAGAKEAASSSPKTTQTSEAKCTECNSFVTTSGDYVQCPSVPGVWYVDRLPLRIPTAESGWCDENGDRKKSSESDGDRQQAQRLANEKTLGQSYASFVVNAGSEVEVALFDVVGRGSGAGAPSA